MTIPPNSTMATKNGNTEHFLLFLKPSDKFFHKIYFSGRNKFLLTPNQARAVADMLHDLADQLETEDYP